MSPGLCAAAESCAESADCQGYLHCRQACVTGDCVGACDLTYDAGGPGGASDFIAFFHPLQSQCSAECEYGRRWDCVDHITWPSAGSSSLKLTVLVVDGGELLLGNGPQALAGVTVKLCMGATCAAPVQTNADGRATLTAPTSWLTLYYGPNGYLDVEGDGLQPALVYWGFPLSEPDGAFSTPIVMFTVDEWNLLLASLALPADTTRGAIAALTLDCFGTVAPDVAVALLSPDAGAATPLYQSGASLSGLASGTDTSGEAFFFDVEPGPYDVTATPIELGAASSHVSLTVRPGTLTEVALAPTP
jgi:hypothetical protein